MRKTSEKTATKRGNSEPVGEADGLSAYRDKRDPGVTNEPFAVGQREPGKTLQGRFIVHQHAATRLHYDLRIQIGNALRSFAVPKGPSLDPEDKRLAVNTEDHPLEYLEFEAVIPAGNYGAGAMIAWDTGRISYLEGSVEEGVERGKIDFLLHGFKLRGRFALVQTKRAASDWLLLKKRDQFSCAAGQGEQLLIEAPRSVFSGMTVEQLRSSGTLVQGLEAQVQALGASRKSLDVTHLTPMLCAADGASLEDSERLYELKIDGVRIVADKQGERVHLRYRNGRLASVNYPEVARAVRALAPERVVLDGEIVAFDEAGKPSFQRLGSRIQARRPDDVERVREHVPVVYLIFDLLQLGDWCLVDLPLLERKRVLMQLIQGKGYLCTLDHLEGDGRPLFELCRRESLEGVVAKLAHSNYRPGPKRTEAWVKIKTEREDDFVIVGSTPGRNHRKRLGALALATYRQGDLILRGRVGSGIDDDTVLALSEELKELQQDAYPCVGKPPPELREASFVRPELVVNVRYLGWSDDGNLRFPVYRGLRRDIDPLSCHAFPPQELDLPPPSRDRVHFSNQDKVFWPEEGFTKGDLCEFYGAVAKVMLPFLRGRPVVLVRYPDGIEGKHFYQWRAPAGTPKWIRTLELRDEAKQQARGQKRAFLIDSVDALLHIANLGCIPIHVLSSREASLDVCDFLTIDLDIGDQPFKQAVVLALSLRELLDELGLVGFVKTSGQKGLHILIPTGGIDFESAKLMVELLGRLLVSRHSDIATMERRVHQRGPRVYVDTGQTGYSRTIVGPYSVRATPGATVSTPLLWDEVHLALDPTRFSMFSVPSRVAQLGDPMANMLEESPDIQRAVRLIGEKLS